MMQDSIFVRPDQELHANREFPTFEGYITVKGIYDGRSACVYSVIETLPAGI